MLVSTSEAGWWKFSEYPNPENAATINVTSSASFIFFLDFSPPIVSFYGFFFWLRVRIWYKHTCVCIRTMFVNEWECLQNTKVCWYGNKTAASVTLLSISFCIPFFFFFFFVTYRQCFVICCNKIILCTRFVSLILLSNLYPTNRTCYF